MHLLFSTASWGWGPPPRVIIWITDYEISTLFAFWTQWTATIHLSESPTALYYLIFSFPSTFTRSSVLFSPFLRTALFLNWEEILLFGMLNSWSKNSDKFLGEYSVKAAVEFCDEKAARIRCFIELVRMASGSMCLSGSAV